MTEPDDAGALARRHLLRGGAVLAGAAGLSAIGAALAPTASAADGQALVQGAVNAGTQTTTITTAGNTTLQLTNTATTGTRPVLGLTPRPDIGDNEVLDLAIGAIVNTPSGPYIGVSDSINGAAVPAYLSTNFDLDLVAAAGALEVPERVLDTRYAASRVVERASTGAPFDSAGRLKAGVWIDVGVDIDNADYVVDAAFLNLTALGALRAGYLTAYPPVNTRPNVSSVNYVATATVANGTFVKVGVFNGVYVVRIFSNQTTHLIVDLTGEAVFGPTAPLPGTSTSRRSSTNRPAARVKRTPRDR